jgi:branched-chain amino acid transport system ATP-binding protein
VIEVAGLTVQYGAATALDTISLSIAAGEMVALIGANGAGKSTLLKALSGIVPKTRGQVHVRGRFAHVPEGRQLFADLTVEDNLRLGAFGLSKRDPAWLYELLPDLAQLARRRAGSLSGGQQQMVALGRGIMARPDVLAIDEMSLGLSPIAVRGLARVLRELNSKLGIAVLLVEQSARLALSLCSRGYVLESGRMVAQGSSADLAADPFVVNAYLGNSLEDST